MTTSEIVATLDEEIGLLERAKALLTAAKPVVAGRRGRPKGSTNQQTSFNPSRLLRSRGGSSARRRGSASPPPSGHAGPN